MNYPFPTFLNNSNASATVHLPLHVIVEQALAERSQREEIVRVVDDIAQPEARIVTFELTNVLAFPPPDADVWARAKAASVEAAQMLDAERSADAAAFEGIEDLL